MVDGPLTPEDERQYQALRADFLEHALATLERVKLTDKEAIRKEVGHSPARPDALVLSDMEEPTP
jgi:hypothetical protein